MPPDKLRPPPYRLIYLFTSRHFQQFLLPVQRITLITVSIKKNSLASEAFVRKENLIIYTNYISNSKMCIVTHRRVFNDASLRSVHFRITHKDGDSIVLWNCNINFSVAFMCSILSLQISNILVSKHGEGRVVSISWRPPSPHFPTLQDNEITC